MKSTLAFLAAGAAGAAATAAAITATATTLTLKKRPSKQPRPILIHPTRTRNRCIGSFNNNNNNNNNIANKTKDNDTFHILKDPIHPYRDTTCLVTFDLSTGQTYQLDFHLSTSNSKTSLRSTGSQTLDVFSTVDSSSSTPSRDRHLARLILREGGTEWVGMGVGSGEPPIFEVQENKAIVLEFVGVGDAVEIYDNC
ncbi:hypothetical protein P168DRAFT_285789 [Aspergillus campestris IBT 28561]|uniref:Ubiquitin 3 binding protein But2 C-terminal domain-containing protein n=1 Tax=Aspergillus campestris (strain IBT 28561) TaxID=1392248 RepID=A0A2I1CQS2_ASPC2|nr:uncharacterized protein P168DRAFT_285789 [Aspergillus campestris IBT 28561]PKX99979.1 hypothetical protein P168DRAFT_285789 [Aspergillus campestris IBT 28561]